MVKIYQTFSDQPKLVSELTDYLYSGQDEKMLATVKLARLLCEDRDKSQRIADLVTYIESNRDGLYGSKSLRDRVGAKTVLVCSTGAMEKNRLFVKLCGNSFEMVQTPVAFFCSIPPRSLSHKKCVSAS